MDEECGGNEDERLMNDFETRPAVAAMASHDAVIFFSFVAVAAQ